RPSPSRNPAAWSSSPPCPVWAPANAIVTVKRCWPWSAGPTPRSWSKRRLQTWRTHQMTDPTGRADWGPSLDDLLGVLDLEQIEVNIFRGNSPSEGPQRVFGGLVAGQALLAAGRTVPEDRHVHSLHAHFIRPGDPDVPIVYDVDRVRDGRSFTTRRVSAIQHGKPIFTLSASFHKEEPGLDHQLPMPDVPPPEELPSTRERLRAAFGKVPGFVRWHPIETRPAGPLSYE